MPRLSENIRGQVISGLRTKRGKPVNWETHSWPPGLLFEDAAEDQLEPPTISCLSPAPSLVGTMNWGYRADPTEWE